MRARKSPWRIAQILAVSVPLLAQTPAQHQLDLDSFEKVWSTVHNTHWQEKPGGLDWDAIHAEFRPKAEKAATTAEMREVMRAMLARLKQTHFGIIANETYAQLDPNAMGEGVSGIDVRVLGKDAVVVRVDPGSSAERAGVKPGWVVHSVEGAEFTPLILQAQANPEIHELQLTRSLEAKMSGDPGKKLRFEFTDDQNRQVEMDLMLELGRGTLAGIGNMPPQRVWFESRRIGDVAYIRFNFFLDLVRVMSGFQQAVNDCMRCQGLILDLRGNPGGIGGMAMGMSGFLVDRAGQKLGTMYMREATLNFVVNPRPEVFPGAVAVLVDGCSASTSEILAEGLKDLGRARVFGTKTAAAALPSNFEKLPNGDGFQYALANYISEGGKPLEGLGVTPDEEVILTRKALLAGTDPVIDAALRWVDTKGRKQ